MESANGTLKTERVYGQRYPTRAAAKADLLEYIGYYNMERRHFTLGYQSPAKFERPWRNQQPASQGLSPIKTGKA